MAHPYKDKVKSGKEAAKSRYGAKTLPNTDMKGAYKNVDSSSSSMQHKDQAAAPGKAAGGAVSIKYPLKKGGSESGVGRLEKAKKN